MNYKIYFPGNHQKLKIYEKYPFSLSKIFHERYEKIKYPHVKIKLVNIPCMNEHLESQGMFEEHLHHDCEVIVIVIVEQMSDFLCECGLLHEL